MIYPVLLCGGSGTRLWPLSRKSFPKQFTALTGDQTLFQAAAGRLSGPDVARPIVITSSDFRFIVTEQLAAIGIDPGSILIEPSARNTAPAILAAVLHLAATDPEALLLVMPCDHDVPDRDAFGAAIRAGIPAAGSSPLDTWHAGLAPQATGIAVDAGHFVAEENPQATLDALLPFLTA